MEPSSVSRHAIYCHLFDTNNPCLPCRVARCHPLSIAFESPRGIRRSFRLMVPPSLALAPSRRGTVSLFLLFILLPLSPPLSPSPLVQTIGRFLMNFFPLFYFTFSSSSSSSSLEYPRTCTPPSFFPFFSSPFLSLSLRERRLNRFALAEASLKWARRP